MSTFYADIAKKKRAASGAYHKRGTNSRKVTLPSDYLTAAQKRKLNGEIKVYNIQKRMTYDEFISMPKDLQKQYIEHLRGAYAVTIREIADMMGAGYHKLYGDIKALGVQFPRGARQRHYLIEEKWMAFLNGESSLQTLAEPAPANVTIPNRCAVDIYRIIDEAMEKQDRYVALYIKPESVTMHVIPYNEEEL